MEREPYIHWYDLLSEPRNQLYLDLQEETEDLKMQVEELEGEKESMQDDFLNIYRSLEEIMEVQDEDVSLEHTLDIEIAGEHMQVTVRVEASLLDVAKKLPGTAEAFHRAHEVAGKW